MTEQRVTVQITGGVADVRLNRPEKRNALDGAMFAGLVAVGERLKSEPAVRAVVLSGEGPDFCAGLDFGSFAAMRDGERLSALVELPPSAGPARATGQRAAYVWTEIGALIGRPNQAEAVAAEFEKRPPRFADPS